MKPYKLHRTPAPWRHTQPHTTLRIRARLPNGGNTRPPPGRLLQIQSDRAQALAAAEERGCIEDYEGQRVSFKGRTFMIRRATLFNVEAPSGGHYDSFLSYQLCAQLRVALSVMKLAPY